MGIADRDYPAGKRGGGSFMSSLTPVVKWLLIVNVAVFFVDVFWQHRLTEFGAFSIGSALYEFRLWEFLTFQFLHDGVLHLLLNMVGLYFFGPMVERWWGTRQFLGFYLLCGAGGAAFYTVLAFAGVVPDRGLVGASAGIYGILAGAAVIAPNLRVSLVFPPIELSMRQLALAMLAISGGFILFKLGGNEAGEAGHLGGALAGFLLVKYPHVLKWARPRGREVKVIRSKAFSRKSEAKLAPRTRVDLDRTSEVDAILDKISRDGFQSLTESERETLHRAANSNAPKS